MIVNGSEEIGVRASICASVFIVGTGAPGGVRLPCAKAVESCEFRIESVSKVNPVIKSFVFIALMV